MIDISSVLGVLPFLTKILKFFLPNTKKYENAVFNYKISRKENLYGNISIYEELAINLYNEFYRKSVWFSNFLSQNNFDINDFKGFLSYLNKKDKKAKKYTILIDV